MIRIRPRARMLVTMLVIVALITSPGCWSRREMDSVAFILVLGIDKGKNENIKLIAQVGLPRQEPGSGGGDPVVKNLTAEGRDFSEALDNMFLKTTKRPTLIHLRLVVFGEELAKEGIAQALDFLRRDIQIRLSVNVSMTLGDIEELLMVEDALSSQPALALVNQFETNALRSKVILVELMELVSRLLETDREAVLPIIMPGDDLFTMGETAVFSGDRMVASLDKHETLGLLLWSNRVRQGIITTKKRRTDDVVSFRIVSSETGVTVRWDGEKLFVQSKVNSVLDINEMHNTELAELEQMANSYIINRMRDTLDVAREEGTDFLGLAVRLRRDNPQAWKSIQHKWADVLLDAEYDLRSKVVIRGQGQVR